MVNQKESLQDSIKLNVEDLLRLMPDALMVLKGAQVLMCNQHAADFFGFSKIENLIEKSFQEVAGHCEDSDFLNTYFYNQNSSQVGEPKSGFLNSIHLPCQNKQIEVDVYYSWLAESILMLVIKPKEISGEEHSHVMNQLKESQEILRKVKVQLVSQEKMATLGQLITGIVHEIFNPLGFIMSNIDTMKGYHRDLMFYMETVQALIESSGDETLKVQSSQLLKKIDIDFIRSDTVDMFSDIDEGISRINAIIKGLKYFSRQRNDILDYDLNNGIQTSLIIAKNEYKYIADIATLLEDIPCIEADGNRVNQVILNMIINAAHAIKDKGELRKGLISIRTYRNGDMVVMEIADSGIGISDEVKPFIFEPFFTTKPVGTGTGLGLSIAYDIIVEQHRGKIEFTTEVGVGTTFIVSLPIRGGDVQEVHHA